MKTKVKTDESIKGDGKRKRPMLLSGRELPGKIIT